MKNLKRMIGLLLVSGAVFMSGCTDSDASSISLIQPVSAEDAFTGQAETFLDVSTAETGIYVHICGEVVMPGVYTMPEGSRIVDVVNAAGGLTQEADAGFVNLAKEAEDGMQILIPSLADVEEEKQSAESGRIDINRASLAELCLLPGIGESKASDIIRYREQNGAFESIEDIMKVTGIKQGLYEKIKEKIYVR